MKLNNKVALVTGAASGIGKEIAIEYARQGVSVAIADLALEAAKVTAQEIIAAGGKAIALAMDVSDEAQVEKGVADTVQAFGGVDILVSNAGIQIISPIVEFSFENWQKMLAIHLNGAFLTTRACMRAMIKAGRGGSIIYMGSVHSHEGSALKSAYVAAKHAMLGLAKVAAKEGAKDQIRVNVICPGFVRTPLVDKQIPEQAARLHISEDEVIKNVMLKDTIDGEFTSTADIAATAIWLAEFPSLALSGQSIVVSHGWHMQ